MLKHLYLCEIKYIWEILNAPQQWRKLQGYLSIRNWERDPALLLTAAHLKYSVGTSDLTKHQDLGLLPLSVKLLQTEGLLRYRNPRPVLCNARIPHFPHLFLGKQVMAERPLTWIQTDKKLIQNPASPPPPIYQLTDLEQRNLSF